LRTSQRIPDADGMSEASENGDDDDDDGLAGVPVP
jgi:hypothetical protein